MTHIKPLSSDGLSGADLLRKAMQTAPPEQGPPAPKPVKAKRKKTAKKPGK